MLAGSDYSNKPYHSRHNNYHNNNSPYTNGSMNNKQKVVTCKNIALGCSVILSGLDMCKHESNCDFNILYCPWPECMYEGRREFICPRTVLKRSSTVQLQARPSGSKFIWTRTTSVCSSRGLST